MKSSLSNPKTARFSEEFDRHYSLVFSRVYYRVSNYQDAEDIAQEVFLRFYRNIESIDNPRKWLLGCMRIVVFDYYKTNKRGSLNVEELFDDIAVSFVNGFRDTRLFLARVLEETFDESGNDGDAELFELIAVHGYSTALAARHLNLGYKQARYRYGRTLEKLMKKLNEKGIKSLEDLL